MTVRFCGCEKPFDDTVDGRLWHRRIFDHAPSAYVPPPVEHAISPRCRAGAHGQCGGGFLRQNGPAECECTCGHVDGSPRAIPRVTCDNGPVQLKTAPAGGGTPDESLTSPTVKES